MEYTKLGNTGMDVSRICLGCMGFGDPERWIHKWVLNEDNSRPIIKHALELGINFFDTANVYSIGRSEEILGRALKDFAKRDEVVIATKVYGPMRKGRNAGGLSRKTILTEVDHSLRRLGTDYIDLYQCHEWDGQTPLEETLAALDDLVRWGKVRYIGCSNYAAWHMLKSLWTADRKGLTPFVSAQVHYSLETRDIENEIVPAALDNGLGILVWSPLAGGLLSGKYRRGVEPPAGSRHVEGWGEPPVYDGEKLYDIIEELFAIAENHQVTPAQIALAYILAKPAVTTLIVGARTEEQLVNNLAAADVRLDASELERLDAVSAQNLPYPFWHHLNAADRLGPADLTLLGRHLKR